MTQQEIEHLRSSLERRFDAANESMPYAAGSLEASMQRICNVVQQFAIEEDLLDDERLQDLANLIAWSSRNLSHPARGGPILAALIAVRDACI